MLTMHSRWNGSRRSGHWLTERWPIAAALLLVGMAALFAAPAQAATVTLVSNFGSVGNNAHVVGDLNASVTRIQAQKFTTGANTSGYTLESLKFKVDVYDGANITSRVSIYSVGSDGKPGSGLYSLTGTITSTGNKTFTAPANATLEASTSYFVYFEDTDSSTPRHHYSVNRVSSGSTLDTGSQSGWTMGARHQKQNAGNWTTHSNQKLAIQLKGTVNVTPQNVEMVSNLGEASTDTAFLTQDWAQTFTAGSSPNGYTLTSVTIDFNAIVSGSPAVSVWSTDSNGRPNSKLADLTNPASITTGANTFTAPAGTTLSMGERYAVAIGQWSGAELKATQRNSEDSGAQSGWSIHDESWAKPSHVPWENAGNHLFSLRIRVNGAINPQERPTYVSNLEQTENNFNSEETSAQAFTTGSFAGGYALESVDVKFDTIPASISIAAAIYSEDADGFPDTQVHSLTSPSTLAGSDVVRTFTAPAGAVLAPSTTYFLVMNPSGFITYARTNSSNEDTAETGWSIANQYRRQNDGSTTWSTASSKSLLIRVNGPTSADATLSGLVLEDASDDSAVELDPTFVSTELSYTAFVSNSVDEITIKPSVNHAAAEFDFLDGSDATLTDADTVQDDFQASLAEGENTIKVKVTASDGNATATYTVDVTRVFPVPTTEVALVSNMGKGSVEAELIRVFAQTFTTGTNPNGYTLTSIELDFTVVPTSGSPAVSLWSVDSDGLPSSKLTDLTNPASITTGANIFTAPAETALSRGESYAVLINPWSGARINVTNANREDDGAQPGWSIRNNGWSKDHPIVPWVPGDTDPESIKVRVNGFVTGEVSADATLSDLTVNDGTDDLILTPAFVPGTYLYAVDVGAAVDEVTLTATVNDDGAAVSGVTLGGAAITDSDFTDGITVPSLVVGDNDIVVTVTAEDTSTALTYTVTVTRAEADTPVVLVSNTAETAVGGSSNFLAQSFETGANATGYTVTEVEIRVTTVSSRSTSLKIREDDGGEPGALVATFMNPVSLTSQSLNTFTAPANTTLEASTTYWISVNEGVSSNRVSFSATSADDETGEMGWSIGNDRLWRASETSNWAADSVNLVLAIKGHVAAAEACDALWCANMIAGSSGDTTGFSDGFTQSFNAIGSLSPSQFSVDGEIITMNSLIIFDDHGDIGLSLEFTHSILGNSDYTLELDDESFILSGTGGFGFFDADASSTFADGDTVAVKLFEGSGGGALSDDATLTSLDFYVISGENEELVTLTPAFHKDTIEYEAGVDYQFIFAAIFDIVRGDSGASVLVTDEFNEYDLQKDEDSTNELDLAIGENTIKVKVTAADGETTVTYTLRVTRAAPPPPEDHCGTGDIWCATLTVASLSGGEFGYSGAQATAQGTLSHVAFYHGKPFYLVERLSITTTSGLRIDFHPAGETVFNTDSYSLVIDGTEFAFSDATFSDGHFEWANTGLSWTSADTVEVRLVAAPPTEVPSDWSLIPADLNTGDQFRLIFLSSTSRTGSDTEITPYNTFVQTLAAAGHTDIQAYRDGFTVVGCTAAVDAVGNTGTFGVGVPIYWLNGAKVADDYADFYDGDWDEEDVNKNELGANGPDTSNSDNYPITGCDHDGTEASTSSVSESLGADGGDVRVGRPDSSDTDHGPLSSTSTTSDTSNHPMYGLSAVFQVAAAPPTEVPSDWSLIPAALTTGDQFRLIFLSSTKRTGSATDIATYNTFVQDRAAAGHTDIQAYRDGFKVVGCTVDTDAVANTSTVGVGVPIYWLNGNKVADDYADFYDEDWDEEAVNKNELGANGPDTSNSGNYPITGCDHDGTDGSSPSGDDSNGLGGTSAGLVTIGRPNSSISGNGPLSSTSTTDDTNERPMYGLSEVFKVVAAPPTEVPSDWSLIPAALTTGDTFRLIFLSSTKRNGSATDIATYNTFVQDLAAAGHADIQAYSDGFRVVGCTAAVDAVGNTDTTGVGVPIYWLNGNKVADDYADFYDEDWDEEAVNKNELGANGRNTNNSGNYPITGCDHDGTEAFALATPPSVALGSSTSVRVGRPNSSDTGNGPISNSTTDASPTDDRPMYGLSEVFKVVAAANSDPTFPMSPAAREVTENTAAGQNVGAVLTASDSDGDTLTYTLEGTDAASFELDTTTTPGSAQIQTKTGVSYDHEVKSSYTVEVKADDNNGGTASVTVTITITDVSEPPGRPAAPTVAATAGSTTSLDVSWNAPTNTGPNIDNYDLQYREGTSGGFTDGPQDVTGTSAAIPSLDAGTSYQVQVRATNAEGDSDWSLSGSGTTTAEACDGIWCATLMPQAISGSGGGLGCANSSTGDRCTNTAHLTEDEFRHDMTDYQVTAVQVRNNNGQLQLWISPDLTTATQSLVLHVGSESFAFEDADTKQANNRRWNSSGLSWSVGDTIELKLTEGAGPPTEVPADWSLIPAALSSGDTFRLIFLSSTKRTGSATDIATYNTFVQDRAAAGHADIQAYSDGFRVVGCTATVDARDNTGTTYTSSNKGVPIYWLSGNKVADDYEDFYDENWDDEANDKNELGNNGPDTTDSDNYPLTGCDHDGTEAFSVSMASRSLGSTAGIVYVGRPNSSDGENGPISNSSSGATLADNRPMYGLSAVFKVAAAANSDPTFPMSTAARSVVENTAAGQNVGAVLTASDSDGDTLTYTLEGTDAASFELDTTTTAGSAQIQTKSGVTYDHEVKSSYTVVVKADDGGGGTAASVTVTITITDVSEAPERPAAPTVMATAGSTTSLSVSWTAPATTGPDIDDYDLRYREGTSGSWSNGPQNVTATLASIGSLDAGTSYQVQVRATNDEGNSNWSLSGSGATTAEATPTVSISADKTSAVFKEDGITYTLTRSGSTTAAMDVTVTLTQTKDFLAATELSKMVTISAGQTTETFTVLASSFQHFAAGAQVGGGTLTATVQDGTDYDLGTPSSVDVAIVIGVMVRLEAVPLVWEPTASFTFKVIARTGAGAPYPSVATGSISVFSEDISAIKNTDFGFVSASLNVHPGNFMADGAMWEAETTYTVSIENDALDEDDETFNLVIERPQASLAYSLVDASGNSCGSKCTVMKTITDDDTAGVTISKSALTVTEQDSNGDTYTVVLDSQPTANVTISIGGQSGTDVTAAPTPMTFTTGNWATAQTVTVTGDDDADLTNDMVSLTHNAASSDSDYQGITITGLTVTVADNDTARVTGVMVEPGNAQLVVGWSEVANASGYHVQWKSGGQSYNTSGRRAVISSGSTTSHTISSLSNGTEYTVRVRATRTGANNGAYSAEVLETPVMPTAAGVTISESALTLTEQDTTGDSYTVVLDRQPTASVTVTVGGLGSSDLTANPSSLTFTTGNWATAQMVTVTAGNDADTTNDTVSLTHSAASSDSAYHGISIAGLMVTVADNDTAQVTGLMITPGNAQLVVEWTAVANATGYEVQWKSGGQSYNTSRQATITSGLTTSHTISSLTNGTEYTVRVRATRTGANNGAYSAEVLETPVMPVECDVLWCATLTVGQHPTSTFFTGFSTSYGALTPTQFTRNGSPITVDSLTHDGFYLELYYTGDLSGSGYTLELGSRSFDLPDPDGDGFLDVQTGRGWSVGDTVEVTLSEAIVMASDDATLESLTVSYLIDVVRTNNAPITPAFSPDTTSYTAGVPSGATKALLSATATEDGAELLVTLPDGSTQHDTGDADEVVGNVSPGLNTFTVTVTAPDGITEKVYTVIVDRGGGLSGRIENLPSSHDGSTAFSVTLKFNTDISEDSIDNLDRAVEIKNGTKSDLAAVGSSKRNFTMTITPSSGDPVRILVRQTLVCSSSGHPICTDVGDALGQDIKRWVGKEDDARLSALWLTTKDGIWIGGIRSDTYSYDGHFSFSELTMQAAPYAKGATVVVTGPAGTFTAGDRWDGGATAKLDVPEGSTTWRVTVTSADGNETKTYRVTVRRGAGGGGPAADVRLKTLTVTPVNGTLLSFRPGFHLDTEASTFKIRVSSGTTAVRLSLQKNTSDPEVRMMRTETRPLDALDRDPDEPGIQLSLPMGGQRLYRSIWVIGPNARVEGHTAFNRKVYQLWITKAAASMATAAEPLMAAFENPPLSHDGSSAFTLRMAFSEDVEITPEDMRDHALTVFGATVTGAEQVEGLKTLWELTLQPSGNGPVSILTPLNRACTEVGALCTADGGTLTVAPALQIAGPPPPQGSAPDTPDRPVGTAVFVGGVDLEWNDVPGADSYDVQLFRNGQWMDLPGDGVEIAFYGAGAIISELDPGSTHWFQVRARNAHSSSDWSDYRQVGSTNQSSLGKQARPDNVTASEAPVINGTAQVGESLTADTTGIEDGNGLDRVQFRFQWVTNDGSADADITGATDSSYTLLAADEGKTVKVRVAFTDRGGYAESLTSAATDSVSFAVQQQVANSPATGALAISGTAQVGQTLTADTSGIADADGLVGATFTYQWVTGGSDIAGATGSTYTLTSSEQGQTIQVRVNFIDDRSNAESLASAATDAVTAALIPLTVSLENNPATHNGTDAFTFEIRFSEEFVQSFRNLKFDAFTVTGGTVKKAQRVEKPSNILWRITVQPHANGNVTIVLPVTNDCDDQGAICTGDGRKLSNGLEFTVVGPDG